MTDRYVAAAEVSTILGVSRQQVHRLAARPDFPTPVAVIQAGRIWLAEDVETWDRTKRRRIPGPVPGESAEQDLLQHYARKYGFHNLQSTP